MGFKGNRGPLLIGVIALVVIIGIAAVASQGSPTHKKLTEGTVAVYILGNTGIQEVKVYIENTDQTWIFPYTKLPAAFNTTVNYQLEITLIPRAGYVVNGYWFYPMDKFCSYNPMPLHINVDNSFGNVINQNEIWMQPETIKLPSTPTPQPTYTIITPPPE